MTKFSFCAALSALVLSVSLVGSAPAQSGGTAPYMPAAANRVAPASSPIGIVDVAKIFNASSRFKAAQEQMTAEMQQFDTWVKQETEALQKLRERMREFKAGTIEYKDAEKELVKREYNVRIEIDLKKKELKQRDAMVCYDAYQEIQQEVQAVASERQFLMVLRFDGQKADRDRLSQVAMELQNRVVYFNRDLDITDTVIARLERRASYGKATNNQATIPRPNQNVQPTRR